MAIRIVCPIGGVAHRRFYAPFFVLTESLVSESGSIIKKKSAIDPMDCLSENDYATGRLHTSVKCAICQSACQLFIGKSAARDALASLPANLRGDETLKAAKPAKLAGGTISIVGGASALGGTGGTHIFATAPLPAITPAAAPPVATTFIDEELEEDSQDDYDESNESDEDEAGESDDDEESENV